MISSVSAREVYRRLPARVTMPFAMYAAPIRSMESLRTYIIFLFFSRPVADSTKDIEEKSKLIAPVHSRCTIEPWLYATKGRP